MGALNARDIQKASTAAHKATSRKGQLLRQTLEATLIDCSCSIGNSSGALEYVSHLGMRLETLELLEGTEPGVLVVQAHHKAHCNGGCGLVQMVQEGAAICEAVQRPANGMLHQTRSEEGEMFMWLKMLFR